MRAHRLIRLATAALTVVGLGGLGIGGAAAEPVDNTVRPVITTIPERPAPPGETTFVNSPALVDGRLQNFESWSRQPDPHTIAVHFSTGTPECYGVHAEVQETVDIIAVKLSTGTLPEAAGRACIAIGVFGTLPVKLVAPVGHRVVVSIT